MSTESKNQPITANLTSVQTLGEPQLLFLELPHDEMSCRITILPPASIEEKFVTVDDLLNALEKHNIIYGIDSRVLAEISAKITQQADTKNLTDMITADIAHGQPAIPSQDAQVEYFYKEEMDPKKAKENLPELEDGRTDYRATRQIDNVTRGSLLIRKTPAVNGTAGKTVTGKTIYPPPGKDIVLGIGKGVMTYPDNPNDFYADEDGQVMLKEGRITVHPIYEIKGDVDFSTGSIVFYGTVIVHGDVKDGFKISAGGDLFIRGVVEGAELQCDGTLTIGGGVSGNDKARISCKGDANIKYIQNATVEVDGNLNVKQYILHSKITCDYAVRLADPKAMIVGGEVIARREITSAVFGSNLGTATEIVVGHQIDLRDQIITAENRLAEIEKQLDKTNKALIHLKTLYAQRGGNLPPDKQELHKWLSRALIKLTSESKMLALKKLELELKQKVYLEEKPVPRINCNYVIYPGVKVTINKAYLPFTSEQKYCSLIEFQGEVSVSAIRSK